METSRSAAETIVEVEDLAIDFRAPLLLADLIQRRGAAACAPSTV